MIYLASIPGHCFISSRHFRTVQMQYDVYRPEGASDKEFNETHEFFLQVEQEDKFLCVSAPHQQFF